MSIEDAHVLWRVVRCNCRPYGVFLLNLLLIANSCDKLCLFLLMNESLIVTHWRLFFPTKSFNRFIQIFVKKMHYYGHLDKLRAHFKPYLNIFPHNGAIVRLNISFSDTIDRTILILFCAIQVTVMLMQRRHYIIIFH